MPRRSLNPTWRKPAGVLAILALALSWVVVVTSFSAELATLPVLVQLLIYAVTGIVWILPLRPLLQWMETGRWRR